MLYGTEIWPSKKVADMEKECNQNKNAAMVLWGDKDEQNKK